MPQELAREVLKVEAELLREEPIAGTITGQLAWWMIHEHLKAMPGMGYLCCTLHLYKIQWLGDSINQLKQFIQAWEHVLNNMDPKQIPSDVALVDIFMGCLSKSKLMKLDYEFFDRIDLGHEDRNPRYLLLQIEKKIRKILADDNKVKIWMPARAGHRAAPQNSAPSPMRPPW